MNFRLALDAYRRLVRAPRVAVICHYDPALTDGHGDLTGEARDALHRLHQHGDADVAVVSERSLEDLMTRVGLLGITYVANHGLHIQTGGQRVEPPDAGAIRARISGLELELREQLAETPIEIENWDLCLSVSWGDATEAGLLARTTVQEQIAAGDAFMLAPRLDRVLILPQGYGGITRVVQGVRERMPSADRVELFMGGDPADEEVFAQLREAGAVTVCVGDRHRKSRAEHRLRDAEAAGMFLMALAEIRSPYPE